MNESQSPDPSGSTTQRERWQQHRALFKRVVEMYEKVRTLPAVVCSDPDEDNAKRSIPWTPDACHFQIDVEHAIKAAIGNRYGADELWRAWENLQDNPDVIGVSEKRLIALAGPIFSARGLEPKFYFRHIKRGSALSRRNA